MYAIVCGGDVIALCDKPRYIKVKEDTGVFVEASPEEAAGVAAGGEPYNLPGGAAIPGRPEAAVVEQDAGEVVFRNRMKIAQNDEATGTAIIEVESALCEIDSAADERLAAVEDALCELDARNNN